MYRVVSFRSISSFAIAVLLLLVGMTSCNAYTLKCPKRGEGDGYHYGGDKDGLYEGGSYGYRDKYKLAACDSATDNTRGFYTTVLKPCVFTFHKCDKDDGTAFQASTVCSEKNRINKETIKEYVKFWPDECVGDFKRCYSVNRDERIFANFFCITKPDWKIPEETTHIGVSCIEDKQAKIVHNANKTTGGDPYFQSQQQQFLLKVEKEEAHMRHLEVIAVVSFVLSFSACLIIVKCAYSWLLRPYYEKLATHQE